MCGDFFVHQGLRKHRFIAFIVTVTAVANYVYDHVFLKTLTIFRSDAGTMGNGFDIISIDMKNRGIVCLGYIRTIVRGSRKPRGGGEADLVVNDDMNGAASFVAEQVGEILGFQY